MSVLFERHIKGKKGDWSPEYDITGCQCSYCMDKTGLNYGGQNKKLHYGLNIPRDWSGCNSWYVIKIWPNTYIRWTNGWFRYLPFYNKCKEVESLNRELGYLKKELYALEEINKMNDNKISLLEEDLWCVHKWLSEVEAPVGDTNGTYSIVGRIKALIALREKQQ